MDSAEQLEEKRHAYAVHRRVHAMRLGVDQSLHGVNNVTIFSTAEFWPDDERWAAINRRAHLILAELVTLQIQLDLIVGHIAERKD